jgi:hypothetical protein
VFEKAKKLVGRAKDNIEKARAKSRRMSVHELQDLDAKEKRERMSYEKWKLEEKYRLKRKAYTKSGGKSQSGLLSGGGKLLDAMSGMGKNVLKNAGESPTNNFNKALTGGSKTTRKRKKKKRKVVVYV